MEKFQENSANNFQMVPSSNNHIQAGNSFLLINESNISAIIRAMSSQVPTTHSQEMKSGGEPV